MYALEIGSILLFFLFFNRISFLFYIILLYIFHFYYIFTHFVFFTARCDIHIIIFCPLKTFLFIFSTVPFLFFTRTNLNAFKFLQQHFFSYDF